MKFEAIPARVRAIKTDLLWGAVSLAVLLACLYYPYVANFPQLDFALTSNGEVFTAQPCPPGVQCLRLGDRVLTIGDLEFERFASSRSVDLLSGIGRDGRTTVRVLRNGRILSFPLQTHIPRAEESLLGTLPLALSPLIFWLMGVVAVVLLRPRDERWLVFVLFSFVTALWVATGYASPRHTGGSGILFHILVWFFLPLAVHLHTILPTSRISRRMRLGLLGPLYGAALVIAVLDADPRLIPRSFFLGWALAAVLLSAAILLLRLLLTKSPAVKVANRTMLFGIFFGLAPYIGFFGILPTVLLSLQVDIRPLFPFGSVLATPALLLVPITYTYAIYKHHLGALEFRANRLVGAYSFSAIAIITFVAVLLLISSRWTPIDVKYVSSVILVAVLFAFTTPYLRGRFQALVDRHVFGIRHTPEEVIGIVSERIPGAFDRGVLARVITDEILPTLLIRQSALYLFADGTRETLYEQALPAGEPPPTVEELAVLLAQAGRYIPAGPASAPPAPRSWVRLAVPLAIQAKAIGVWLIGRRDPDDYYPVSDVRLLSTVANQIAPMVENIRLYERAQQEIAQRKTAEREIRRSEERFRNLFEATLEGIAIVRNGRILEVNHALLSIFGCTAPELIGRDLSELVSEGESVLQAEPREGIGWKSDRTPVEIEIAAKKYVFQGEDVTVVAIRDIARRKRDEAENKMLQRQLLLSQKMEAIGRLSAGVAHDFNNCLLAIFGYSDLLLEQYMDDPFLCRNLSGIKDAGQKAASLTKQLLAFARRQPMEKRVMDLNVVVAGVEKMLQRLLGEDVALLTDLSPTLARIKIDPGQMEQVIVNLAVNARQAMPSGGRLVIRTAPLAVGLGRPAPHADVPPGSYIMLTVLDTGIGMDPETQQRIFEPFFSTKGGEGTGLGLSTVYGIIRQSGGYIFVDSAPGQGTCFTIYLPATEEREGATVAEITGGPDSGSETLLLVEDEEDARAVLRQILAGKGYRVLAAASGDEAMSVAAEYREPIDLLLTDVTMPRMKGTELAARLLAVRPHLKVIYMSGYNEEPLLGEDGGPLCLQKPFSAQAMARAVRDVLDTQEGLAQAV